MKSKKILLLCLSFFALSFLGQFAAAQEQQKPEEKFVTTVKFQGSVDRDQAIAIAKEFLQFKGIAGDYFLEERGDFPSYLAEMVDGVWNVVFLKKVKNYEIGESESIRIKIDPDTGEVIDYQTQQGFYVKNQVE